MFTDTTLERVEAGFPHLLSHAQAELELCVDTAVVSDAASFEVVVGFMEMDNRFSQLRGGGSLSPQETSTAQLLHGVSGPNHSLPYMIKPLLNLLSRPATQGSC